MVRLKLSLASSLAVLFSTGLAMAGNYPEPDRLVEAGELAKPAVAKRFRVLDTRTKEKYLAGHVPGALWVDHDAWSKAFAAGTPLADWGQTVGELGIKHSTPLIIYDDGWARNAAHVWWLLRYWGFEDVRLLNGGWHAWLSQGLPQDRTMPQVKALRLKLRPIPARLAGKEQVLGALKNHEQIIDARSVAEFRGEGQTDKRKGAIANAKHLEWSAAIDPQTLRFRPAEDLTRLLSAAGIDPARPAIVYSRAGERSAVVVFTLEVMGAKNVRSCTGGWEKWSTALDTPAAPETKKN
ncbi:MAG TPA: rhodanese-like domain-containing protein [Gemmataceae bacterium]|nr:rhodanese-like domain-containing protein [Gemmataceae bacterium]